MDLTEQQRNNLATSTLNASHVRRRAARSRHNNHRERSNIRAMLDRSCRILLLVFILINCQQESAVVQSAVQQPSREIAESPAAQQPSQSFTPSFVGGQKQQQPLPTLIGPISHWLPPIGNEKESEFFMSESASQVDKKHELPVATSSELPTTPADDHDEEATTIKDQQPDDNTTTACPGDRAALSEPEQNEHTDELIAINATRKQFVTHDQLLTKEEPAANSTSGDASTGYQRIAQSSRAGMSRLASSFGLTDFFSRYVRPKPQQQQQQQPDRPIEEAQQQKVAPNQPPQSTASCPGACLDFITAAYRCRNAIEAPCPTIFQKCCELDDVSFNGTPVETSAPITGGDSDNHPVSPAADVAQTSEQVPGDQQSVVPTTLRPPTTAAPAATTTTTAATPIARQQNEPIGLDQRQPQQLQSSVYFLSSASDDSPTTTTTSNNNNLDQPQRQGDTGGQNPHLEQRLQVRPSSAANDATAAATTKPAGPPQATSLAQPAGQQHEHAPNNSNQKTLPASQSFDLPLRVTTSMESKSATPSPPTTNRVVVLQTANGTAHVISGPQSTRTRPLYTNLTDYQLLRMRPQQSGGFSPAVVYHSNIDPVRKLAVGSQQQQQQENSTSSNQKQTVDLTQKQPVELSSQSDKSTNDYEASKVLKDQHSATNNNQEFASTKQKINPISAQQQQPQTAPTTTSTTTTTTVQPPQQMLTTTTTVPTSTENRLEPSVQTTQQQSVASGDATSQTTPLDAADQEQTASPVSGIANVLSSLFDAFMSPASSAAESTEEARVPPNYNSAADNPQQASDPLFTSDSLASSQFDVHNDQQNDRRLGLDLSFRQQNQEQFDRSNSSATNSIQQLNDDGSMPMTSDGSNESPSTSSESDKCSGYCSLEQFEGLCDYLYPSSQCGPSQKCCINGQQQQQRASLCRGTCLPVHQSSLCIKPNELQFNSPSCSSDQVCCNQPQEEAPIDDHQQAAHYNNHPLPGTQQQSPTNFANELLPSGSATNNKHSPITGDGLLSASLVPPPPPTLAGSIVDLGNSLASSPSIPRAATQLMRNPTTVAYQQPTARPPLPGPKVVQSSNGSQPNGSGAGGLMNQFFQMLKSNTGLGKQQRPKTQQTAPQPFVQQQPIYELQAQSYPMLTSGSAPRSQAMLPTQIVFPMMQQQPMVSPTNGGAGQLLMVPNQMQTTATSQQPQQVVIPSFGGLNMAQTINGFDVNAIQQLQHQQQHRNNRFNQPASALVGHNRQQSMAGVPQYPPAGDTMQMVQRQQQQFNPVGRKPTQVNQFAQDHQQQQQPQFNQVPNYPLVQQQQQVAPQKLNSINRQQHYQPITDAVGPLPPQHNIGTNNFLFAANNNNRVQSNVPPLTQIQNGAPKWTPQQQQQQQQQQMDPTNAHRQHQQQFNSNNFAASNAFNGLVPSASNLQPTKATHHTKPNLTPNYQPNIGTSGNRQQWVATQQHSNGNTNDLDQHHQQQHRIVPNINNDFVRPTIKQWNRLQSPDIADTNVVSATVTTNGDSHHNQLTTPAASTTSAPVTAGSPQRPKQSPHNQLASPSSNQTQRLPTTPTATTTTTVTTTAQPQLTRKNNAQVKQTGSSLASAASNVNVMISSSDETMPHRQQTSTNAITGATAPQVSGANRPQPPLIINNDEEAVADESDDQSASVAASSTADNNSNEQRAPCHAVCLAASLAFSCGHIEESLACPSSGQVCCVKQAALSSVVPAVNQHNRYASPSSTSFATSTTTTSADGNKLDNQPISSSDDNSDENGQPAASSLSDSGTESHHHSDPSTVGVNTILEDDQQTASNDRQIATHKVQATACGLPGPARRGRNSSGRARGRVMGGFDSEPGYWCWQAALMNEKNEYLCGGALIGTKWVLTAAHCITQHLRSESQLFVRLGQTNLNSTNSIERKSARSVLVKTSYVHHNHNGVTLDNDIALLRLEDSVDLEDPTICTICLPERAAAGGAGTGASSHNQLEPGKRCTVTGYGFEQESGPAALRVRQTDLPIVSDSECQNKTSLVLGKPFSLPASSFCAGGELGQDACHGDGGSPLACLVDGFYELTGIVSWGYKCGNKDLPGLYAKVTNFVGWINQIVSVNN